MSSSKDHSSPSEIQVRSYRQKLRWTSFEVSSNNRFTKILRLFIYQTGRECLNMDVTRAFPRMQQAWLMQIVISPDNMQIVSGLGVYQSILNPAVLKISKIGYCTMIEVSCTDFSAVYTVLKLAQMVSDVLEQYDVVITIYIVIFNQGKKIK